MKEIKNDCIHLILDDVLTGLDLIQNHSVDLVFLDPPYNIGKKFSGASIQQWSDDDEYLNWCYKWLDKCIEKLKHNGSLYLMSATQFMPYLDLYIRKKLEVKSRIIWYYDSSGMQAKNFFGSLYEPILFCVVDSKNYTFNADAIMVEAKTGAKRNLIDYRKTPPQPYNTMKVPGNTWYFARVRYRMPEYQKHPSQKPEALLERIIKASSNINDIILDPFSGTFTTSSVAKKLGRKSIGIEISEEYFELGKKRLNIENYKENL